MTSVTVVSIVRDDGFVAYTFVSMLTFPSTAALLVHVIVIDTGFSAGKSDAHTSPNATLVGSPDFVRFHTKLESTMADMSLLSDCGESSLTGIDTSLLPMPPD